MTNLEFKSIRKSFGYSQEEMAKELGVTRRTVINYEKGEVIPETIVKLIHFVKDLHFSEKDKKKTPEESEPLLEEVNKKLDRALAYLVRLDLDSNDIKEGVSQTYEEVLKRK